MEKKTVENTWKEALRSGEQVLWQGKSEAFPLMANDAKGQILGKWIGTCIAAVALLMLYIKNTGGDNVGVIVGVFVIAAVLILSPFVEQRSVMGQCYCVTDQRVLLITRDRTVYYMELSEIDDYKVVSGKMEYNSLVFGSCIFEDIKRQLRWRACHPKTDSLSGSTVAQAGGLVLFNLKDSGKVEELVQEKSKVNG